MYEVELKFPVTSLEGVAAALELRGARFSAAVRQADRYFAHPARDFARTDEALRIRSIGEENRITYKGPKLDAATKTRREIELPLPPGRSAASDFGMLLGALGFTFVAEVVKQRRSGTLPVERGEIEAALDVVEEVGSFLELEMVVPQEELDFARTQLLTLAAELNLGPPERRSYLEMLLVRG